MANKTDTWIVTVLFESQSNYSKNHRLNIIKQVKESIEKKLPYKMNNIILLFPAGWFKAGKQKASSLYDWAESSVSNLLAGRNSNFIACFGIDGGFSDDGSMKDQIGMAVNKKGILSIGRKFYPSPADGDINLAQSHFDLEFGKSRQFNIDDLNFYISVCYDVFGIKNEDQYINKGVHVILNLIHQFNGGSGVSDTGGSGVSYFARLGLAGASYRWKCPVFAASIFVNKKIQKWPSGVFWSKRGAPSKSCTYSDISIKPVNDEILFCKEDTIVLKTYTWCKSK